MRELSEQEITALNNFKIASRNIEDLELGSLEQRIHFYADKINKSTPYRLFGEQQLCDEIYSLLKLLEENVDDLTKELGELKSKAPEAVSHLKEVFMMIIHQRTIKTASDSSWKFVDEDHKKYDLIVWRLPTMVDGKVEESAMTKDRLFTGLTLVALQNGKLIVEESDFFAQLNEKVLNQWKTLDFVYY